MHCLFSDLWHFISPTNLATSGKNKRNLTILAILYTRIDDTQKSGLIWEGIFYVEVGKKARISDAIVNHGVQDISTACILQRNDEIRSNQQYSLTETRSVFKIIRIFFIRNILVKVKNITLKYFHV